MTADFLLELLSEEIPARMQAKARNDLARLFAEELARAGLSHEGIVTWSTPRRLVLVARAVPAETEAVREEVKGPRASAPPQALDGFLRKTGLAREQLEERDGVFFAVIDKPGRPAADVLGEAVATIIRDFPWPKSMRWGAASASMSALRWVRPLHSIVAILGEEIVPVAVEGVTCGATTFGHRFHHPGPITIGGAFDYAEKLRACHVIVDHEEREAIVRDGARAAAGAAGLALVEDEGLVVENAGLTEWPVPLLGKFDPDFLDVPREVIVLTMRTNQKYFACTFPPWDGEVAACSADGGGSQAENPLRHPADGPPPRERGGLAPAFVCTANIAANDGGAAIVEGNRRVLAARLSDARFFWEQDLKVPLEEQAKKLAGIVFHEKLGTVADKVERVAKLARWLVEEGIVRTSLPAEPVGRGTAAAGGGGGANGAAHGPSTTPSARSPSPSLRNREELADLAERAARLAKADLVTGMVGEFPELQGIIGGYLAAAQGEPREVSDAIRDHYKPVGQGDEVPTAPVTVAVSLADKLDTLFMLFEAMERPTGSKDPYALRRQAISIVRLIEKSHLRLGLSSAMAKLYAFFSVPSVRTPYWFMDERASEKQSNSLSEPVWFEEIEGIWGGKTTDFYVYRRIDFSNERWKDFELGFLEAGSSKEFEVPLDDDTQNVFWNIQPFAQSERDALTFIFDRLKVQQREAGVRHDLIDAVFALGGEDDLVRLLARVRALQAFVETGEGKDLLAGYKRAANILAKEGWSNTRHPGPFDVAQDRLEPGRGSFDQGSPGPDQVRPDDLGPPEEIALLTALEGTETRADAAIATEDFTAAMAALASLRAPIDAFFDQVIVNDPDPATRERRLALLARFRDAVHRVADFSKIEG